ncbi:hypothetical protein Dxin01_00839 [Deinococcus xinjiangensis]|uniref:Uncharacterized protein n=1 Tax=Deinococcus xinjiangensis TaxID=457454 RepID=A0ABP9VAR8_9DEIO
MPTQDFSLMQEAVQKMYARVLSTPLTPVLVGCSFYVERLSQPLRLHLTLDGEVRVAALLNDEDFREKLSETFLAPADVERATLRFTHDDLTRLSYSTEVLGVDAGTAALLEEAVKVYISGVRRAAERAAGMHTQTDVSEGERAASSSLNAGWFGDHELSSGFSSLRRAHRASVISEGEWPF